MAEKAKEIAQSIRLINFPSLEDSCGNGRYKVVLSHLEDVPVTISACLGYSELKVADLLAMEEGNVLELEKTLGQMAELYINDQKFGLGEVLVTNNHFAIRIQSIDKVETTKAHGVMEIE